MNHVEICEVSFMYEEWKHLTSLIRNLSCMLLSIYNFQQMLEKTCTLEKTYPGENVPNLPGYVFSKRNVPYENNK